MTPTGEHDWGPGPEQLAAYFDGELPDALRRRVEAWLAVHPEAREELAGYRRLAQLWREAAPPEPAPAAWRRVRARLRRRRAARPAPGRRLRALAVLAAAAAAVVLAVWYWNVGGNDAKVLTRSPPAPPREVVEVFPVATAGEVTVLRVEGADTNTVVVGELPVRGPLELAGPGDVVLTSVQPADGDNMVPRVLLNGPNRPMIWAQGDTDEP